MTIHVGGDLQTEQRCDSVAIPARRDACAPRMLCPDLGPQHLDNWDAKGLAPPFAKVHGIFPGPLPDSFSFTAVQWRVPTGTVAQYPAAARIGLPGGLLPNTGGSIYILHRIDEMPYYQQ